MSPHMTWNWMILRPGRKKEIWSATKVGGKVVLYTSERVTAVNVASTLPVRFLRTSSGQEVKGAPKG